MKHKFKVGETYKTRSGQEVKILANYEGDKRWANSDFVMLGVVFDGDGFSLYRTYTADGKWDPDQVQCGEDLVPPGPVRHRGVINIYQGHKTGRNLYPTHTTGQKLYPTPEEADRNAMSDRVASVWVEFVEGEFAK